MTISPHFNRGPLLFFGDFQDRNPLSIHSFLNSFPRPQEKEILPQETVEKMVADVKLDVSYPGKPAKFIHESGNWELFTNLGNLCRSMKFISTTEDSFIKGFELLGNIDGTIRLCIDFAVTEDGKSYLKSMGFSLLDTGFLISSNDIETKIIFNILAKNNEIPKSHFQMIKKIIEEGKHTRPTKIERKEYEYVKWEHCSAQTEPEADALVEPKYDRPSEEPR